MNRARKALYPKRPTIKLKELLKDRQPPANGLYKLRLEYNEQLIKAEYIAYEPRPVASIKLMRAENLHYSRKYADRGAIDALFKDRGRVDDILMTKNGYLMDTSYANIALYDGYHWYTPSYPLLKGVRREKLLKEGTIRPAIIRDRDLANFKTLRLMNAMLRWGEGADIAVHRAIRF